MNFTISEESRRFVEAKVASGRYTTEDPVIEDALRPKCQLERPPTSGRELDNDPLWGMFRDEPELIDQIRQDAMRDRWTIPLRTDRNKKSATRHGHLL